MDTFNLPITYTAATYNSHASFAAVPKRIRCSNLQQIGFARSLSQLHNCYPCNKPYYNVYQPGDILPFQFHLKDVRTSIEDPTNPIVGWHQTGDLDIFYSFKAALYDNENCDTPLYDLVDEFTSDYWTGFSSLVGSIQTLFVDTGLFPNLKGFTLRVASVKMVEGVLVEDTVLWSEPFEVINPCISSLFVHSNYANTDMLQNDHRPVEPPYITAIKIPVQIPSGLTRYYNARRYKASIVMPIAYNNEDEKNENNKLISTDIFPKWEFRGTRIAAYAAKEFHNIISATNKYVDFYQNGVLTTKEFVDWSSTEKGDQAYTNFIQNYTMQEVEIKIKHTIC